MSHKIWVVCPPLNEIPYHLGWTTSILTTRGQPGTPWHPLKMFYLDFLWEEITVHTDHDFRLLNPLVFVASGGHTRYDTSLIFSYLPSIEHKEFCHWQHMYGSLNQVAILQSRSRSLVLLRWPKLPSELLLR